MYRETTVPEVLEAATARGPARLERGPKELVLIVGARARLALRPPWLTLTTSAVDRRGRPKKPTVRSLRLDPGRLLLARRFPTGELALWSDTRYLVRELALEPVPPLDQPGLDAADTLNRFADAVCEAVIQSGVRVSRAIELGQGENRAIVELEDELVTVWVRPLFHNHPRRRFVVFRDGRATVFGRRGRKVQIAKRDELLVRGDFLCFEPEHGAHAAIWLPFVGAPERRELETLLRRFVDVPGLVDLSGTGR
jgi:hypothetical protein